MINPKNGNRFMLALILNTIFIGFVMVTVAYIIFSIGFLRQFIAGNDYMNFLTMAQQLFVFLLPVVIFSVVTKARLRDLIPHQPLSVKNILYVIVLTFLFYPIMGLVSSISSLFVSTNINEEIISIIEKLPFFSSLIALAIMPAINEEIVFRGVMFTSYKSLGIVKAVLLSALFFGLIHQDFYQLGYAMVAGIFFALLVAYTNSIYASMLSHFIINGSQVLMQHLLGSQEGLLEEAAKEATLVNKGFTILTFAVVVMFVSPFIYVVGKRFINRNKDNYLDYLNKNNRDINDVNTNKLNEDDLKTNEFNANDIYENDLKTNELNVNELNINGTNININIDKVNNHVHNKVITPSFVLAILLSVALAMISAIFRGNQ